VNPWVTHCKNWAIANNTTFSSTIGNQKCRDEYYKDKEQLEIIDISTPPPSPPPPPPPPPALPVIEELEERFRHFDFLGPDTPPATQQDTVVATVYNLPRRSTGVYRPPIPTSPPPPPMPTQYTIRGYHYRVELCNRVEKGCPVGLNCHYAHSRQDLLDAQSQIESRIHKVQKELKNLLKMKERLQETLARP
jgi:hypothetical protein